MRYIRRVELYYDGKLHKFKETADGVRGDLDEAITWGWLTGEVTDSFWPIVSHEVVLNKRKFNPELMEIKYRVEEPVTQSYKHCARCGCRLRKGDGGPLHPQTKFNGICWTCVQREFDNRDQLLYDNVPRRIKE